jgi:hypothetical protein
MRMTKKEKKVYRKLLSKRKMGTYQDVAQYILNNKMAYNICFSDNVFFVLNDFEIYHFNKLLNLRNDNSEHLDEIMNKVISFWDDDRDEASIFLDNVRRKKKIDFHTKQLNKINVLNFNFNKINELLLTEDNVNEFCFFCRETKIKKPLVFIEKFTKLLIHNIENRIDFFLYDSLFFYLIEDFCYEKKYEIEKIEDEFDTIIDSKQTPFKHKFSDYSCLGDFLKENNGLHRNLGNNKYYPQTYGEACFDDLESFFSFVVKITLSQVCRDEKININTINKFKSFYSSAYKSIVNEMICLISDIELKEMFTIFKSKENVESYQNCLAIETLEKKATDSIWEIINSIKSNSAEKDIILINNNTFNISMRLHNNGKFGFLNNEKELFLNLFKSYKSFSKSTLIIKEKTKLKYNSNEELYYKIKGYYFGEYSVSQIPKADLFKLKGNKMIVEYKI